jgi:K+-transporting ATPase ATPase C chain
MKRQIITGLKFLALMIILTGVVYPGLITVATNLFFKKEAQGSLIEKDGIVIGSELIGQNFDSQKFFWSRPSANNYNPLPSGGSNLGLQNPILKSRIINREHIFLQVNKPEESLKIPSEMVTASASGLDPHISPAAALLQVRRIASARGMNQAEQEQIVKIIHDMTEKPQFSLLGEARINVFRLNLKVDSLK